VDTFEVCAGIEFGADNREGPMTSIFLGRGGVALSLGLAAGLAGGLACPCPSHAADLAVPAADAHGRIVRVQAAGDEHKQRRKASPKATAPGGQNGENRPKFMPRDAPMTGPEEPRPRPPQLVRCPGPSPECPPSQM